MIVRIFGWSLVVTAVSLAAAYLYGGTTALVLCLILGVLEVSLSFDNAVVNATVLRRMSPFWQRLFLTVGILIAVFGMRLLFPVLVVSLSAALGPLEAFRLALAGGDVETPGTYAHILEAAHPKIAGFGGMFLLMLFLNYMFDDERENVWIGPVERVLGRFGRLNGAAVLVSATVLLAAAELLADDPAEVLFAGVLGMITYLAVDGLGSFFEAGGEDTEGSGPTQTGVTVAVAGRAAFFLFLYLEVLDATFSFDGVIGAFAITSDPVIIALGLGLIGAMFVRSITVFLVRQGTLDDYVHLESGAHWAIGALAAILLLTVGVEVNQIVTGLTGVLIIAAAFVSSVVHNRRLRSTDAARSAPGPDDRPGVGAPEPVPSSPPSPSAEPTSRR